ncbi:u3 snornp-associated protein utp11 [Stemphylium lycopersici]|nr:u3 snornp-associated protein utp11 [Stemphylium lycopersici]
MSSMRNAVQRRNHKERAQPLEREKWGLLEKRKDYKLRAADHRDKKAKLKILSQKARDRNPDEFSFKMMSSQVDKQGRKVADRGNKALSVEVVKLLKTQDAGYIRTMLQVTRKEREELEKRLVMEEQGEVRAVKDGEDARQGKHRVFVENEEEQEEFDADTWFGSGKEMPKRSESPTFGDLQDELSEDGELPAQRPNTMSKKQIEAQEQTRREARKFRKDRERAQERTASRLQAIKKRESELMAAEEELEVQRAKMNNTVGGVNKNGVKFKPRRHPHGAIQAQHRPIQHVVAHTLDDQPRKLVGQPRSLGELHAILQALPDLVAHHTRHGAIKHTRRNRNSPNTKLCDIARKRQRKRRHRAFGRRIGNLPHLAVKRRRRGNHDDDATGAVGGRRGGGGHVRQRLADEVECAA